MAPCGGTAAGGWLCGCMHEVRDELSHKTIYMHETVLPTKTYLSGVTELYNGV